MWHAGFSVESSQAPHCPVGNGVVVDGADALVVWRRFTSAGEGASLVLVASDRRGAVGHEVEGVEGASLVLVPAIGAVP